MGILAKFTNDTKPDENCECCRIGGVEVTEKLNIFSGKRKESIWESMSLNLQGKP